MKYVWVNEGGETCCGTKHGGVTLAAAVDAEDWKPIPGSAEGAVEMITTRNHWIGWPDGTVVTVFGEQEVLTCEYCEREDDDGTD